MSKKVKKVKEKKAKEPRTPSIGLKSLIKYLRPWRVWIIIAIISAIASATFLLIGPQVIQDLVDYIIMGIVSGTSTYQNVLNIALWLVFIYGMTFVLGYLQQLIMTTVTQKFGKNLRTDLFNKVNQLPLSYLDSQTVGDTLSRVTNDVDTLTQSLTWSVISIITAVATILGAVIFMFVNDWIMALTALGSSIVGFVLMGVIISKAQVHFTKQQEQLGDINGHIEEYFTGHTVMKVNNARAQVSSRFDFLNKALFTSGWKSQFFGGLMVPLIMMIGHISFVAVCVVGGILVFNDRISFGVIITFMLFVQLFNGAIGDIAQAMVEVSRMRAASDRVFELLKQPEMLDEANKPKLFNLTNTPNPNLITPQGNFNFKNVKFGYKEDELVIKDFSLDVKAGSKIAIVGPTGAGKTTLVNILMKFYELNEGDILIDGQSIKDISRVEIANLFSMVLQDTWVFNGTIKENLIFNLDIPAKNQQAILEEVTKSTGIYHFISTLPLGFETVLDEERGLSNGQRQLLTIARAMIKNAPFLILDEATSSVDTRTEILVKEAMDKLATNRTSFIIAHRLSTIKNADQILVLNHGDIVEIGNHEELLAKDGFYAQLYNSQFDQEIELE